MQHNAGLSFLKAFVPMVAEVHLLLSLDNELA
jgi:hypothetical protein